MTQRALQLQEAMAVSHEQIMQVLASGHPSIKSRSPPSSGSVTDMDPSAAHKSDPPAEESQQQPPGQLPGPATGALAAMQPTALAGMQQPSGPPTQQLPGPLPDEDSNSLHYPNRRSMHPLIHRSGVAPVPLGQHQGSAWPSQPAAEADLVPVAALPLADASGQHWDGAGFAGDESDEDPEDVVRQAYRAAALGISSPVKVGALCCTHALLGI